MDVKAIQARLAAHAVERNWDPFFSPRSLSMALASEGGALLAKFQWLSEDQARRVGQTQQQDEVAESLADVILYAVRLADIVEVDLDEAVAARAASKYPVSARRFEGVEEASPPAQRPAPPPPSAPPRPAPEVRRNDPPPREEARRSDPPPRVEPRPAPAPAAPIRTPQLRVTDDAPREPARSAPAPARSAPVEPVARQEPQRARPEPAARERGPATRAPAPRTRNEPPAARPAEAPPAPRGERYANLDTNAVLDLMKALTKRIDDSRSDDTILHEIKDEMATLRRNLYSSKSKPAWIAGGLERLRALLEEAAGNPVGDKVNFRDAISGISTLLDE